MNKTQLSEQFYLLTREMVSKQLPHSMTHTMIGLKIGHTKSTEERHFSQSFGVIQREEAYAES